MPIGLAVGSMCPDVTLTSAQGESVNLRAASEKGPVVLVWYHLAFTGG